MKFWKSLFVAYAIAIAAVLIAAGVLLRPLGDPAAYMVAVSAQAARDSILNCGNVAFPSKGQAESYSQSRPGTHAFRVTIR
jgi:hypothetical protein